MLLSHFHENLKHLSYRHYYNQREKTVSIYVNSGNILAVLRTGVICTVQKGRHMLMVCFFFKLGFRDTPVYFDKPGGS